MPDRPGDDRSTAPPIEETIELVEEVQDQITDTVEYSAVYPDEFAEERQRYLRDGWWHEAVTQQMVLNDLLDTISSYTTFTYNPALSKQITPPVEQEKTEMPLVNSFKVGCDPEFVAFDELGRLVNLAQYPEFNTEDTSIGYDHGGTVGELRPEPHQSTYQLVKNIHKLVMNDKFKALPKGRLRAGAMATWQQEAPNRAAQRRQEELDRLLQATTTVTAGLRWAPEPISSRPPRRTTISLGGHVHLDVNPLNTGSILNEGGSQNLDPLNEEAYNYSPYSKEHILRLRALDHLTLRLEALDILPRTESQTRRRVSGYGRLGEFRVQNPSRATYNSTTGRYENANPRMEYRSMASWLFDPKVAFTCLTAAKLAAVEPKHALETLGKAHSWANLVKWFETFKNKDVNVDRLLDKVISKGHTSLVIDPDGDLKTRWEGMAL